MMPAALNCHRVDRSGTRPYLFVERSWFESGGSSVDDDPQKEHMQKILIIDDHDNVRLLFEEAFEAAGYQVLEAADGRQGIDTYTAENPDIVLTDIEMPVLDGHAVIREIRKINPDAKVIAVTGAGLHHLPVAHDLGADRIFETPLRPGDLIAAVKELIP